MPRARRAGIRTSVGFIARRLFTGGATAPPCVQLPSHPCLGGEIGRRKGLRELSTRRGNGRREWGQSRWNSSTLGWLQYRAKPGAPLTPIGRSEGMAVGTQEAQVFQPVVMIVPVYVVEFERNGCTPPHGEPASVAARLENACSQQTTLQLVGLNRHRVAEIGLERLSGRKRPIAAPRSTRKVGCVDLVALERATQSVVVPAIGGDVETRKHLSHGQGAADSVADLFAGALESSHALPWESVET